MRGSEITACIGLIFAHGAAFATEYHMQAPFAPWLWPLLIVIGILCELGAAFSGKVWLLGAGFALVIAGCLPDRDLALFVGNSLACAGLYFCRKS